MTWKQLGQLHLCYRDDDDKKIMTYDSITTVTMCAFALSDST